MFGITKIDVWVVIALVLLVWFALKACKFKVPDPTLLGAYANLTNSKGGIIILLTFMWFITLGLTISICLWAIIHGIDPQNGILILLLGVLTSGAWGNVNGAWLRTLTGEDPKPPMVHATETTSTSTESTTPPPKPAA